MAKTSTSKASKGKADTQTKQAKPDKQQKKHLKREANLKLKIELVLKDLRKAERKATKATAHVDELTAQLQELNGKLTHNHESSEQAEESLGTDTSKQTSDEETPVEQKSPDDENIDNGQSANGDSYEDSPAIEELHQASLPPAEGRNDINGNADSSSTTETTEITPVQQSEEQVTSSDSDEIASLHNAETDEEHNEVDQQETEHLEEHHPSRRRSSHRHTTTDESHES